MLIFSYHDGWPLHPGEDPARSTLHLGLKLYPAEVGQLAGLERGKYRPQQNRKRAVALIFAAPLCDRVRFDQKIHHHVNHPD